MIVGMKVHKTTIHTRCPYAPVWDYYTVVVEIDRFLKCEDFQELCDRVRGETMTQEKVFDVLRDGVHPSATLTVKGRHGQNSKLVVTG